MSLQMQHLEDVLRDEQQQHDLTRLKLSQAEASLRESLAKANNQAERSHSAASANEAKLQQEVVQLQRELADALRASATPMSSRVEEVRELEQQLQRVKKEAAGAEDERRKASQDCSDLRKQLSEANQRVLVRNSYPCMDLELQCALCSARIVICGGLQLLSSPGHGAQIAEMGTA
jgi:predicted nuclease with TOPRIM domain